MRRTALLLCGLVGLAMGAGDPPGFTHIRLSDLRNTDQQLAQKLTPQKTAAHTFGNYGTHTMMLSHMEASGQAEIHENVTDVFIIQSGEANLTIGGNMVGRQTTAPGEARGTSLEGGASRRMEAGDIINIPAGTPHHTQIEPGKKVTYFIVKVRAK